MDDHPKRLQAGAGGADVRRRARCALDPASPRHPQGQACAGDLLHRRRKCAHRARLASTHDPRGPRGRQPHLHPPKSRDGRPDPDLVRIERDAAAVRGVHRPDSEAVSRALLRGRRADHGGRNPAGVGSPEPRLYLGRPARRQRGLAAARRTGDHQQRPLAHRERAAHLQRYVRIPVQPQRRAASRFGRRPQPDGRGIADPDRYAARARLSVRGRVGACRALAEPGDAAAVAVGPSRGQGRPWPVRAAVVPDQGTRLPVRGGDHARHRASAGADRTRPAVGMEGAPPCPATNRSPDLRQRAHSGVQRRTGDRALRQRACWPARTCDWK